MTQKKRGIVSLSIPRIEALALPIEIEQTTSEPICKRLVQKRDEVELELKKIQQNYHNKFFTVLSASKVFDVLRAEERFHRQTFRNMGQNFRQNHSHRK